MPYAVGSDVMCRWPGSDVWFQGQILAYNEETQQYSVVYGDGTQYDLQDDDILSVRSFGLRSHSSRSRSRSQSPGHSSTSSPVTHVSRQRKFNSPGRPASKLKKTYSPSRNKTGIFQEGMQGGYGVGIQKEEESSRVRKKIKAFCVIFRAGAIILPVALLFTMLTLLILCQSPSCSILEPPDLPSMAQLWNTRIFLIYIGWVVFQTALYALPLGKVVEGLPLRNGQKLKYRVNGFHALVLTAITVGLLRYCGADVALLYDHILHFAVSAALVSFLLSLFLYYRALHVPSSELAPAGNTGDHIYDWFLGHELNPRFGSFDLKYFCELRPGLIGWALLDVAYLLKEDQMRGVVSLPMVLVCCFQLLYIGDALWHEECLLSTMDIVREGFGFMLAFGDLAWVPFVYSLQGVFLLTHPRNLHWTAAILIFLLKTAGYMVFRGSNSEKNTFRKNPKDPRVSNLLTIPTSTGKQLLISGWWGILRHPNYLGDLMMALSWSLPCGKPSFSSIFHFPSKLDLLLTVL
uniref:Delta(14)-sterol reductase TM7SF2 n=1 Tax=Eptatretus burgeri TaxID=7764 RepID=A0A8C4Q6G3_EPTBU